MNARNKSKTMVKRSARPCFSPVFVTLSIRPGKRVVAARIISLPLSPSVFCHPDVSSCKTSADRSFDRVTGFSAYYESRLAILSYCTQSAAICGGCYEKTVNRLSNAGAILARRRTHPGLRRRREDRTLRRQPFVAINSGHTSCRREPDAAGDSQRSATE